MSKTFNDLEQAGVVYKLSEEHKILNVELRNAFLSHTLSNPGKSGTQSKVSSPLTFTSTYFPQIYQITTP